MVLTKKETKELSKALTKKETKELGKLYENLAVASISNKQFDRMMELEREMTSPEAQDRLIRIKKRILKKRMKLRRIGV